MTKQQFDIILRTYPTRIVFSAAKKSMKNNVARTKNIMEYGFKGLVPSLPGDEWSTTGPLDVNPKAGRLLCKASIKMGIMCLCELFFFVFFYLFYVLEVAIL